ncbi:hypothetical protein NMG60_11019225 [Bertholletia excelsa]
MSSIVSGGSKMESSWRCGVVLAVYFQLIMILAVHRSEGRDLRPSEHGLAFQNNVTGTAKGEKSPEMLSFFGASSTEASVPLPMAKNMSDASWWSDAPGGRGGGGRRDQVRHVLVVATVVCAGTGVALLVVAGLLFLVQYRRERSDGRPK